MYNGHGALYRISTPNQNWGGGGDVGTAGVGINASSSNSIYTDNGKVYPASVALNFIIKT